MLQTFIYFDSQPSVETGHDMRFFAVSPQVHRLSPARVVTYLQKPGVGHDGSKLIMQHGEQNGFLLRLETLIYNAGGDNKVGEVAYRVKLKDNHVEQFRRQSRKITCRVTQHLGTPVVFHVPSPAAFLPAAFVRQ